MQIGEDTFFVAASNRDRDKWSRMVHLRYVTSGQGLSTKNPSNITLDTLHSL